MKYGALTVKEGLFGQIAEAAKSDPTGVAVTEDDTSVTYSELISKSASIAGQLYENDCQVEEPVAIITNGGIDMIAGMIGCLQVAATFVPLDVHAPVERTQQMLSDLEARNVIVDNGLAVDHIIGADVNTICSATRAQCTASRPLDDTSVIYGFFTSGSTGQPKCCLNTHLGLSNRFAFNSSVKELGPGDSVMQNSKHTFDAVLWQTLWPLTKGATVVIPRRDNLVDIERTIDTIRTHNVVMTDTVPSVLTVLLDYFDLHPGETAKLESLTELFVGGEEISAMTLPRPRTPFQASALPKTSEESSSPAIEQ